MAAQSASAPARPAHSQDRCDHPARNASSSHGLEGLPAQNAVAPCGTGIREATTPYPKPPTTNAKKGTTLGLAISSDST